MILSEFSVSNNQKIYNLKYLYLVRNLSKSIEIYDKLNLPFLKTCEV